MYNTFLNGLHYGFQLNTPSTTMTPANLSESDKQLSTIPSILVVRHLIVVDDLHLFITQANPLTSITLPTTTSSAFLQDASSSLSIYDHNRIIISRPSSCHSNGHLFSFITCHDPRMPTTMQSHEPCHDRGSTCLQSQPPTLSLRSNHFSTST